MAQTIFSRLRSMKPRKGQPLSELIAEASDVGDELLSAVEMFTAQAVFDVHTRRVSVDEFVLSKARAAERRAYADNGHTPDNGKAAA